MTLNKKVVEEYLKEGCILIVDEYHWYAKIKNNNNEYLGTVVFKTYLKMNLKNFERVETDYFWMTGYKLKEGYSIWK